MAKFYRQDKGIISPPPQFKKYHISWTLDNILCGFNKFYEENDRWPVAADLKACAYLPNVKTLERNFEGIIKIREQLGLKNVDYRKGEIRSIISKRINIRAVEFEDYVYKILVKRFFEPFVHYQSRVIIKDKFINVDYLVFHKKGKFAVDVFYPDSEKQRWSNNISVKYKTYKDFPYKVYLCIGNEKITRDMININNNQSKTYRNSNVELLLYHEFIEIIDKYESIMNPYV